MAATEQDRPSDALQRKPCFEAERVPSPHDPCLFISEKVICLVYADDCLFFSPNQVDINKMLACMKQARLEFGIKNNTANFLASTSNVKRERLSSQLIAQLSQQISNKPIPPRSLPQKQH
eukprot:8374677-Ditylum_brightwellii.AAC.1